MYETPQEFVVELEVPGFAQKDLGLEVADHVLVVKGEAGEAKEEKEKHYLLRERLERFFERRFHLPVEADTERLSATFDRGVLSVHVPKSVEAKPRKVAITAKT